MPGSNFAMKIERVPNDSISFFTCSSMPLMIDAMSMTVMTPIITPMTVRKDRSLLARRVCRPIAKFS